MRSRGVGLRCNSNLDPDSKEISQQVFPVALHNQDLKQNLALVSVSLQLHEDALLSIENFEFAVNFLLSLPPCCEIQDQ